ncbi:MAG: imidazoleglycerol-phosphate dehydratase HisB [Firmicutes bacterium]|nr:imidazoleglycerol-phosphate dehydratase HisB [Bacillota bacterium]
MREAEITRNTKETKIRVRLALDGSGEARVRTGIGFMDHMLTHLARYAFMDLEVEAEGDLEVDCHHTVEDIGIVLGDALREALGDKAGIRRFGSVLLPMDDVLVAVAVDFSGRPYLGMEADFTVERLGSMDTEMFREFFYALAVHAGMNLHIHQMAGINNHHLAEAMFKGLGQCIDQAVTVDPRIVGVRSTKGIL